MTILILHTSIDIKSVVNGVKQMPFKIWY